MAQVEKKFVKLGTGAKEINSRDLPANFTPSNYTPDEVASEGTDKTSAHLKGIDNKIATIAGSANDIVTTSFSGANNQASAANITGFSFNNANVRSFNATIDVAVDATADLFEQYNVFGIQKGSDWDISIDSTGDDSQVDLSITSAGQIQYTSANYAGFVSLTMHFRAWTNDL